MNGIAEADETFFLRSQKGQRTDGRPPRKRGGKASKRGRSRGDMIVRKNNLPLIETKFDALLCWMDESPLKQTTPYIIKHTTNETKAFITEVQYKIDINTLHRSEQKSFELNDIGRILINTSNPLFFDAYNINRNTGSFILIDPESNRTVAAGWIKGRVRSLSDLKTGVEKQTVSTNVCGKI